MEHVTSNPENSPSYEHHIIFPITASEGYGQLGESQHKTEGEDLIDFRIIITPHLPPILSIMMPPPMLNPMLGIANIL